MYVRETSSQETLYICIHTYNTYIQHHPLKLGGSIRSRSSILHIYYILCCSSCCSSVAALLQLCCSSVEAWRFHPEPQLNLTYILYTQHLASYISNTLYTPFAQAYAYIRSHTLYKMQGVVGRNCYSPCVQAGSCCRREPLLDLLYAAAARSYICSTLRSSL
jgi:hypothetical protein